MGHYLITVGLGGDVPAGLGAARASWSGLACAAALGFVTWLGLSAPVRPRLAQLAFLAVFGVPGHHEGVEPAVLALAGAAGRLARPRWRLNLLWQFSEIAVWIATMFLLLGYTDTNHGIDYGWLMFILLDPRRIPVRDFRLDHPERCGTRIRTSCDRAVWTIRVVACSTGCQTIRGSLPSAGTRPSVRPRLASVDGDDFDDGQPSDGPRHFLRCSRR